MPHYFATNGVLVNKTNETFAKAESLKNRSVSSIRVDLGSGAGE
jgi:hypothetical protein